MQRPLPASTSPISCLYGKIRYNEREMKFMNWFNYKITDAMRRVLIAREKIARRNPFFASILFNARLVESDRYQTIWTDGMNVYFNRNTSIKTIHSWRAMF